MQDFMCSSFLICHLTVKIKDNIIEEHNCPLMVPYAWFGSCAIGCREPCQVRKEAAISGSSYVPQISLLQRHAELLKGNVILKRNIDAAVQSFIQRKPPGSF